MELVYDQTYDFSYVKTFSIKSGLQMFEITRDGESFNVIPRKYQLANPPKMLRCRIKEIADNGYVKLTQDLEFILRDYYKPGVYYTFTVLKELPNDSSGLPTYVVFNEDTELEHRFFSFDEKEYKVGDQIRLQTRIKEDKYGVPRLFFYIEDTDFDAFAPEKVFESIPHCELYDEYFKDFVPVTNDLAVIQDEMLEKIERENRLWVFDYLKLLKHWATVRTKENLKVAIDCNSLIIDIEEWILSSGLLAKFSAATREETRLKIVTTIANAQIDLEVLLYIQNGKQEEYLKSILESIRGVSGSEHDALYRRLLRLIIIDPDLLDTQLYAIAEIIALSSEEVNDEESLNMITQVFRRKVIALKKQINSRIHYQRSTEINREQLADITVGLGTLLMIFEKSKDEKDSIDLKGTFAELCKYLAFLTDKDKAALLIDKALEVAMGICDTISLDVTNLLSVATDPDAFTQDILSVSVINDGILRASLSGHSQIQYHDGCLTIMPSASHIKVVKPQHPVLRIVGTSICVASGAEDAKPWDENATILYYKKKWEELTNWDVENNVPSEGEVVTVRVKDVNNLKNMVFCTVEGTDNRVDGVISQFEYLPSSFLDDINDVFERGMRFRVIYHEQRGKVYFSLKREIRELSKQIAAKDRSASHNAVCLGIERGRWAFFITDSGAICVSRVSGSHYRIEAGHAYTLCMRSDDELYGYPSAFILGSSSFTQDQISLLKNQLNMLCIGGDSVSSLSVQYKQMPHVLLIVDQYLRFVDDNIVRYNLYQAMRVIARAESSQLFEYYSSKIHYLESLSSFAAGDSIDENVEGTESLASSFPSLKEQEDILEVLRALGDEGETDYLFNSVTSHDKKSSITKIASLVLASNLIKGYGGPKEVLDGIREFIAEQLGAAPVTESADDQMDNYSDDKQEDMLASLETYYGVEDQMQEFKSSIVFSPESSLPDLENQLSVIMRTVCGFLNAKGGTIWIGVLDSGYASGIASDLVELDCNTDRYERIIRQNIVQSFGKDVNGTINIEFIDDNGKKVCKMSIPPYIRPISIHNEFFQRQGNETRVLKGNDLVLFIERRMLEKRSVGKDDEDKKPFLSTNDSCLDVGAAPNMESVEVKTDNELSTDDVSKTGGSRQQIEAERIDHNEPVSQDYDFSNESAEEKLTTWISKGRQAELRQWLEHCGGKDIPQVRDAILTVFGSKRVPEDDFWELVAIILESNSRLFRKPLADSVKDYVDVSQLDCSDEVIDHVVNLLFEEEEKVQQGIDFLIPFKTLLTRESISLLEEKAQYITMPEGFDVLFSILEADYSKKISILSRIKGNLAAYYAMYKAISQDEEENGIWHVRKIPNLEDILDNMKKSFGGNIVWGLIHKTVFHEEEVMSDKEAEDLISGGYLKLMELVNKKAAKELIKQRKKEIYSYVGDSLSFKVIAVYKNHYLLSVDVFKGLLPKEYANQSYNLGDVLKATVRKAYRPERLFLVTQKSAKTEALERINLVEKGDVVEVRFSLHQGIPVPNIQGMSPLTGKVIDYPRFFDYKKKYQAEVTDSHFIKCELSLMGAV